jgi:hypothetical protein
LYWGENWKDRLYKLLHVLEDFRGIEYSNVLGLFGFVFAIESTGHSFQMCYHFLPILGGQVVEVEQSATDFVSYSACSSYPTLFLSVPYKLGVQHCYYLCYSFFEDRQLVNFDFHIQRQFFYVDFEGSVLVRKGNGCFRYICMLYLL